MPTHDDAATVREALINVLYLIELDAEQSANVRKYARLADGPVNTLTRLLDFMVDSA